MTKKEGGKGTKKKNTTNNVKRNIPVLATTVYNPEVVNDNLYVEAKMVTAFNRTNSALKRIEIMQD